jgi:hypothetical protein
MLSIFNKEGIKKNLFLTKFLFKCLKNFSIYDCLQIIENLL